MIFRQYLHFDPVGASYFFGCGSKASGAVLDPVLDVDQYLKASEATGMQIKYVIDTHVHADHLSGARRLAEATGAQLVLHASAGAAYPFRAVHDGDELELGNTLVRVIHTPGHTPESMSLVVTDNSRSREPWFVLTGHTLMIGDVGRTELATAVEEGAAAMYDSMQKLLALPDHLEVYPGAFSGSVCGRSLSGKPSSTIGFERLFNRALAPRSKEEFVEFMSRDIPPAPPQAAEIRKVNLGLRDKVEA